MCWTTHQKWRTRPRIAKKKIEVEKVYRLLLSNDGTLMSPVKSDKITPSMRHKQISISGDIICSCFPEGTNQSKCREWNIREGYHSYKKGLLRLIQDTNRYKIVEVSINPLFGAYGYLNNAPHKYVVVKCYIPVGAEYFVNEHGFYVSSKIIVGNIIPDEDLLKR